jgi:hypothetical protein
MIPSRRARPESPARRAGGRENPGTEAIKGHTMRWKIIIVNAGIVLVVGILSYLLLAASLGDVVSNPAKRKTEVAQALRAASAQLALDAARTERWLDARTAIEPAKGVYAGGTIDARQQAATAAANKLRDEAVADASFAKMAPSLVLFVDKQGVALGRNGSALMRGDKVGEAYPSLMTALASGNTMSDVWLNRERQEQLFVSYAPVRGDDGTVIGAIVLGTALSEDRLQRTSELTSGQFLALSVPGQQLELVATSGGGSSALVDAVSTPQIKDAEKKALDTSSLTFADAVLGGNVFGATPLVGYGDDHRAVLAAAVPASLVGSLSGLLWPVFGVTALGLLLVGAGGVLLGNYFEHPVSELEEGLLAIINGRTDLRFQIEHPDLGGLVFRINSLLNALMGVPEDTTDDEGRPSVPAISPAVFEDLQETAQASGDVAAALAAEAPDAYYQRLFNEYIAAKRQLGEAVEHITQAAFVAHIRTNEQQTGQRIGRPVRYQVQIRNNAIVLAAVPLP